MRRRVWIWILACLLMLAGAWLFWRQPAGSRPKPPAPPQATAPGAATPAKVATILTPSYTQSPKAGTVFNGTNRLAWRLNNTSKTIGQLTGDRHAILLENAFIDTSEPLSFSIPEHLRSQGDPGAYIVQARGPIDAAFRAMLVAAGAEIVAYIPNDAYLVRAQAGVANGLAANPLVQSVVSYEPYYKIQSALLTPAMGQMDLPDGTRLKLGLFPGDAASAIPQIEKLGGKIVSQENSPFGPVVQVIPPKNWTALATLPEVQFVEPVRQRVRANDLSRVATGVAANTLVASNYMNLTGSNVMVEVNDSGIDAAHPDFGTGSGLPVRVFGDFLNSFVNTLVDTDGHGTHVAGIIAGNGLMSTTITNASGSIITTPGSPVTATNYQFRGMAPLANLLSMDFNDSDQSLQMAAALTNALISNNSWNYNVAAYDLAAASYDAAVRDALPTVTGSQPVLFVFAAGNNGGGDDGSDPGGGFPDTILSPATAKNVITVGAVQEFRNITNKVTTINADGTTNISPVWQPETSTSYRAAGFSSRGNVGINLEGTYGRFKPDVAAPGTFVISTRSEQWDIASYFYINPTNHSFNSFSDIVLQPGDLFANVFPMIPANTVQTAVYVEPNADSPVPFPTDLPIYFGLATAPAYTAFTANDQLLIPPDGGLTIADLLNSESFWGFNYAVSNSTTQPISFDVFTDLVTTNNPGDYFLVLSNLDNSIGTFNPFATGPGPYYRYESGTSMSAADVSGVLALMQDYFTNTLGAAPSPALLKAMVINGARASGFYNFHPQNAINYEGWGVINLSNSLPVGVTTNMGATGESMLLLDQNPATGLATGDSHTYSLNVTSTNGQTLPVRITLAWTDPPGDPAAAIKLVNDLNLVVSNSTMGVVYYGNDIPASSTFNSAEIPTNAPVYDSINNVENVYIQPGSGTNFLITVQGFRVNVNAVTAHTNNVVQDYALVISYGNGTETNAFTVTDIGQPWLGISNNPTADQQITQVTNSNTPLLNQLVGASTPLLGTNLVSLGTNLVWGNTNAVVTVGMTNQWHFFVVTNTTGFTNAAFVTFIPDTLSIPRMGVFAGSTANATQPEADLDLYVSTDPSLTNLNPVVITNCVTGPQVGMSVGGVFNGSSLGRGGTEFVVDTNSDNPGPNQVYYVGVYSEAQEASEFGFIPIFSQQPFSQMNQNGSQIVNGVPLPVSIPDGTPARPGHGYVFGIALYPTPILQTIVTNITLHQNFGDLIGTLTHDSGDGLSKTIVLNNHISLGNPPGPYNFVYDDSGFGNVFGSQPTSGPGSLNTFVGDQGYGIWRLTETDDSLTQVGSVTGLSLLLVPHQDLQGGINGTVPPLSWFYDFIDVPSGTTSLTIAATNLTGTGLLDLYVKYGSIPTLTDANEIGPVGLTNGIAPGPGNSITINAPAPGRYWVGLYNNSAVGQSFYLIANLVRGTVPGEVIYSSGGAVPLLDDAVTTDSIFVTANQAISSMEVALRVDHPRVSDLVFHLISPGGTRVLLVENRGGSTTEGMGSTLNITNVVPVSSSGGAAASSNIINVAIDTGTLAIYYNFYSLPDEMVILDQSGATIFDSGLISGSGVFNVSYTNSTYLTIEMNPFGNNGGSGDLWDYTVNALQSKQNYLVLTEDTNKTITPIKFAPTPFVPNVVLTTYPPAWHNSFEGSGNYEPGTGTYFAGGWFIEAGNVDVYSTGTPVPPPVGPSAADEGTNYIDMDGTQPATISTNIPTVAGQNYTLSFTYSRNPDGFNFNGIQTAVLQALQNGNSLLIITNNITNQWTNLGWATTSVVFTATSKLTKISFKSLDPAGDFYGPLLDCVDLTSSALNDGFENTTATNYVQGINPGFGGWQVVTNQVTVISNASLAHSGTNLLALADGQIYRALPTIPGTTYNLSFAYRGPGAVSLWRGESNANDSIGGNNPVTVQNITYTNGQVGKAMVFNGTSSYIEYPASASLNVGNNISGFTLDTWVYWVTQQYLADLFEWNTGSGSADTPVGLALSIAPYNTGGNPDFAANLEDTANGFHTLFSIGNVVAIGSFQHVALTYDKISGNTVIYQNGVVVANANLGTAFALKTGIPLYLGWRPAGSFSSPAFMALDGYLDEPTIYNRPLSASEIQAIYKLGSAGLTKFATNAPSIAQGLAEAQMTLNGTNQPILFGNNTNWQTATYSFVATSTNTPLLLTGLEPGMLLDDFVMTTIPTNNYDLYYQPEQSLDTVKGENAYGQWQLEAQDDRVGATHPAPSLVSWQLRFNFPFTPPTITTITNTQVIINNIIPPNTIQYYLVIVPTNADMSTNILLNTTGPLNLIFDAANPPIGILPPDYLILSTPITVSNSAVLTTTSAPTNFAAGGTYYLGVQNLNAFSVNYDIAVNFHLLFPFSLPPLPELLAIMNQPFVVTNSAIGGLPPVTNYVLTSTVPPGPPPPAIDTNGVITWTPIAIPAPQVYTFTNIASDSTFPTPQTATNVFHVLVVLTNGLPSFLGAEGAGGFAIGGRGGDVYHVVNLNDQTPPIPGSLRYGIESTFGSRTIVFDVSGAINLISPLKIANPYFTIAGQTAPGDGITIQGLTFSAESAQHTVESAHDEILRFLRCRPGDIYSPYFQGDSFHFNQVTNSIADHLSASWSINTVLSTLYSTNITVQWSMIAESLNHSTYTTDNGLTFQENGNGSLIRYGSGAISYLHNLYADNFSQNPRLGDNLRLDFINNVVCNWGGAAGTNADDTDPVLNPNGYTNYLNYRGNYFIAGNNTTADPNIAFASGVPNAAFTQIYESTNLIDSNPAGGLDGLDTAFSMFAGQLTQLGSPTPMPEIQVGTNSPAFAYEQVLAFAGASVAGATAAGTPAYGTSLLRDSVDTNIVINVRNKSGQIIDFINPTNFPGVYFVTNSGTTYSNYTGAGSYWVSQGYNQFVGVNPWPVLSSAPQPLDSDGDGLPDYWEMTLEALGQASMNPSVPNNNHSNPDGYTDLEEYLNWLAAPHALTVSNTPVDVDLYAIVGRTGSLIFSVTNGTNGTVTLGSDGHTATFMPTNNYFGFASFGFTVTNPATSLVGTNLNLDNGFDVTVSVMISVTNIVTSSLPITNAVPSTNTVPAGGIVYYLIDVPVNAQLATNILSNVSGGTLNLIFSQAGFPTGTNIGDYFLLTGSAGGTSILSTSSMPTNIVPGGSYYLGVQNLGGAPVSFNFEVDFYPPPPVPPAPIQPVNISSIIATNFGGTNGFLIQWYAPTNDLFRLRWAANLGAPVAWNLFTNLITYTGPVTTTNGLFSFFDDGSQTGGFGPQRFYQLLLVQSANLLALPFQPNLTVSPLTPIVVTNTATDSNTNALLNYTLTASPTNNATISSNGIINWTPLANGTWTFTTVVTDNGIPPAAATNSFTVTVAAPLVISSVSMTTNGQFRLQWMAPNTYQFQVEWATNLASPVWNFIPSGPPYITSGTTSFTFVDTNAAVRMKFYRLIQKYP